MTSRHQVKYGISIRLSSEFWNSGDICIKVVVCLPLLTFGYLFFLMSSREFYFDPSFYIDPRAGNGLEEGIL